MTDDFGTDVSTCEFAVSAGSRLWADSFSQILLAEASTARVSRYLETFAPRTVRFSERLGFRPVANYVEPVTSQAYVVMQRDSRSHEP